MRRLLALLVAVGALAYVVPSLITNARSGVPSQSSTHDRSDRFWYSWYLRGQEIEVFTSLQELSTSADLIVTGQVRGLALSRTVERDGQAIAWYVSVKMDVGETLKGAPSSQAEFEVFFSQYGRYLEFLRSPMPEERVVVFLRNKMVAARAAGWSEEDAQREALYHMLANQSQSYFRDIGGAVHVPVVGANDFTSSWEGRSFGSLTTEVAKATAP